MSRFMFLLCAALFPLWTQAAVVLVLGDSLSAGYGLRREEAWPVLLEQRLRNGGGAHEVVNASISGDTTAGGRSRLPPALARHKPDVVVLALGANDGLRGLPPAAMKDNLAAMIEASRKAGAQVLLVGMEMPPNYGADYVRKFRAAFADLARESGTPLVPFLLDGFAADPAMFQPDGLHPVAAAQPRIVDTVWPKLLPLLQKPR